MKEKTFGTMIASLRKEKNMTQLDVANFMCVTDKAVSKWERDLSCPDVHTIAKLADCFGVSVTDLMQCENTAHSTYQQKTKDLIPTILAAIPIAMGIAVAVLSMLGTLQTSDGFTLLGIGLGCVGCSLLHQKHNGL